MSALDIVRAGKHSGQSHAAVATLPLKVLAQAPASQPAAPSVAHRLRWTRQLAWKGWSRWQRQEQEPKPEQALRVVAPHHPPTLRSEPPSRPQRQVVPEQAGAGETCAKRRPVPW